MSPLREDCKSFSSFSSLLLELDMALFTHKINLSSSSVHNHCFSEQFAFKDRKLKPLSLLCSFHTNLLRKPTNGSFQALSVLKPVLRGQSPTKRDSIWRPFDWLRFLDEQFPRHFCSLGRWWLEKKAVELER